jgi:hypothetical protein
VTNVSRGPVPTYYSAAHVPHDGFLADFLMRNKGFVSAVGSVATGYRA